jgi:hypothetical protein
MTFIISSVTGLGNQTGARDYPLAFLFAKMKLLIILAT